MTPSHSSDTNLLCYFQFPLWAFDMEFALEFSLVLFSLLYGSKLLWGLIAAALMGLDDIRSVSI
jgi:hypothetical protein